MHIAILSSLFPPFVLGGAEISAHHLASELRNFGHRVSIFTSGPHDLSESSDGMTVHRLRIRNLYSPLVAKKSAKWKKPIWHMLDLYNPFMKSKLTHALSIERPDLVHCHNIDGFSCSAWHLAYNLGIPVIQHLHDYHLCCVRSDLLKPGGQPCQKPNLPCWGRTRFHAGMIRKFVSRIISPSRFCYSTNWEFLGLVNSGIPHSVIPNGTPFTGLPVVEADWQAPRIRVLFMGQLTANKGTRVLLSAIRLCRGLDLPIDFHVAGRGPLEGEAMAAAKEGQLTFHGFVSGDNKIDLFRTAHILVFPSIWRENNPVAITEALALGIPVIGSRIGGIPELLDEFGKGELLFEPNSPERLKDCLLSIQNQRARYESIASAIRAVRQKYSMQAQTEATLKAYSELLQLKGAYHSAGNSPTKE